MLRAAALIACLCLVACGSGEASGPEGASLTVSVQPDGPGGPAKRTRIECERLGEGDPRCRRLAKLNVQRMLPVPPNIACTEIYGGPKLARVTGELRGERIDVHFSRADGCEIERWNDNAALLGGWSDY